MPYVISYLGVPQTVRMITTREAADTPAVVESALKRTIREQDEYILSFTEGSCIESLTRLFDAGRDWEYWYNKGYRARFISV